MNRKIEETNWKIGMETVENQEELDKCVNKLEEKIREAMEAVAPMKIISKDPDYLGNWMTPEMKERKKERNKWRLKLIAKGRKATEEEWKNWRTYRNKVAGEIEKGKKEALRRKAEDDISNSSSMFNGVEIRRIPRDVDTG